MDLEIGDVHDECNEPVGTVRVLGGQAHEARQPRLSNSLRGSLIPQLIDELPLLAVIGTQVPGGIEIRDAAELRVKETDRIAATVSNLRAMGAEVEEYEDGLAVAEATDLRGALIYSRGDHRIAMAFTVAALLADGESEISGADCVAISFPEFYRLLDAVVER
jgi:3-phosphoshikimate 1-carboxyvinyltransferase